MLKRSIPACVQIVKVVITCIPSHFAVQLHPGKTFYCGYSSSDATGGTYAVMLPLHQVYAPVSQQCGFSRHGWLLLHMIYADHSHQCFIYQVVSLGSGLETRAWRLPLPERTAYFEIDDPDMIAVKQERLAASGAHTLPGPVQGFIKHPLRAASWAGVPSDLAGPDWHNELLEHGFDRGLQSSNYGNLQLKNTA